MLNSEKQIQTSGANSLLIQAHTINYGIDEKRIREIFDESYIQIRKDLTNEAKDCAKKRVKKLESLLLEKCKKMEDIMQCFADPGFQFLLSDAQRAAAITERESDYELICELLSCRMTKGKNRKIRASITNIIKMIDQIDDDALCALTLVNVIQHISVHHASCKNGIKMYDSIFTRLLYHPLPKSSDWIDHLEILGAIRINSLKATPKFLDVYGYVTPWFFTPGINTQSDNFKKAIELLTRVKITPTFLVKNDFLPNFVKLPILAKEDLKTNAVKFLRGQDDPLAEEDIECLAQIMDLYDKSPDHSQVMKEAFSHEWDSYPSLKTIHNWWDGIKLGFDMTHIGRTLAHVNAQRCAPEIPDLPLPQ